MFRNGGGLSQDSDDEDEDELPQPRAISWEEVAGRGAAPDDDSAFDDAVRDVAPIAGLAASGGVSGWASAAGLVVVDPRGGIPSCSQGILGGRTIDFFA